MADLTLFYGTNPATGQSNYGRPFDRVTSVVSATSVTINADTTDMHVQTALAGNVTYNAPTGTPKNGQRLTVRIKDDGTPRTIAWSFVFLSVDGTPLPTTTTALTELYAEFVYNDVSTMWEYFSFPGFAYTQSWQDVLGSRAAGVTYYNTTTKPIDISIFAAISATGAHLTLTVNGSLLAGAAGYTASAAVAIYAAVPPNHSYVLGANGGTITGIGTWKELRD